MRPAANPIVKDVVLVGAGHAHVGVVRAFGMQPIPGVRLTLVTRQIHTPYSGMLPGLIAGHYSEDQAHIDTGPLCRFAGARLYHSEVTGLDLAGKRILCDNRPPVPYDIVSIDIGSTPGRQDIAGVAAHAIPVKPVDGFLARFEAARLRILAAGGRARIGVVGAGPGGVELLLALEHRLRADCREAGHDPSGLSFFIVTPSAEVLPSMPAAMRRRFTELLNVRGIRVVAGRKVIGLERSEALLDDGARLPFDEIFWTTKAEPAPWLRNTDLALDDEGFIRVNATLASVSHPGVFAVGDIASIEGFKLPRSGVYAVRAGKPLTGNIRAALEGHSLVSWRPQRDALYLISTGNRSAVGTRNGLTVAGDWVWRWKDWIDRRFMDSFNVLPEMPAAPAVASTIADPAARAEMSAAAMRCGGCGAKVGAGVLSSALRGIVPTRRSDVVIGLDAPDDAAVIDTGGPRLTVQSVDYFRAPIDDPYVFGKIAANHALGDIYAMGGEPQSALAVVTLPYAGERKIEDDLTLLMTGANAVLAEAGCALVGGHTSEGAELAMGFAITGLVGRERILRKSGLRPGDALVLTKPLGTGVLHAADMRAKARARWISGAVACMLLSSRRAAAILAAHGANGATDVTGFGLAGHLIEMAEASKVDVRLDLAALPLLDGVGEALAKGHVSSLQLHNARARRAIRNDAEYDTDPDYPILFDPQTAGGLLAAVPAADAASCVAELRDAGYRHAAVIGQVATRSDDARPITIVRGSTR